MRTNQSPERTFHHLFRNSRLEVSLVCRYERAFPSLPLHDSWSDLSIRRITNSPHNLAVYIDGVLMSGGDTIMPTIIPDPVAEAKLHRYRLKALEQNLQQALDDAIARGILKKPVHPAINKLLAHLRARPQAAAF